MEPLLPRHLENDFQLDRGAERKVCDALDQQARSLVFSEDVLQQLRSGVSDFRLGPGANAARRLSNALSQLAHADPSVPEKVETTIIEPLRRSLDQLRRELKPQRISTEAIPGEFAREWVTPDGRARVQVLPKGDPNDTAVLRDFVSAVLAVEPNATGEAVALYESCNTVVRAFIAAGIFALSAITVLLWITLRRLGDVMLTLVPLLLAGVVTLELCVVFELPLNFANIIALPLLLGVGVAFKIYYIMAWRAGKTALLQSVLTRA